MKTNRIVLVAGVSLALVAALGAGVIFGSVAGSNVYAQGPNPTPTAQTYTPGWMMRGQANPQITPGAGACGNCLGQAVTGAVQAPGLGAMMGVRGFGYTEVMLPSLAKALGITVDQLQAEFKAGKTVQELAKAKGIALEKLAADVIAAHKDALAGLVKSGKITQQVADWMIDRMDDIQNMPCLTGNVVPGQGGQGGMMGRGGGMMGSRGKMGGWNTQGTTK